MIKMLQHVWESLPNWYSAL